MQHVVISGGTGTVGRLLCNRLLEKGYAVTILTRGKSIRIDQKLTYAHWNVAYNELDHRFLPKEDFAFFHLAGASVIEQAWSSAYKQEIIDSRVKSLHFFMERHGERCAQLIAASGTNYYFGQENTEKTFAEDAPVNTEFFLGEVCKLWEEATFSYQDSMPCSVARTGTVLSNRGGAFKILKSLCQWGVLMPLGNGQQYFPWIHNDDLVDLYLHLMEHKLTGAYNAVAPEQIRHKSFLKLLAKQMNRWLLPPLAPAFLMKLVLNQRAKLFLNGAQFSTKKITETGFSFQYPTAKEALADLAK